MCITTKTMWKSWKLNPNYPSDGEVDESEERMRRLERGGGGEGHVSSDEEDVADDADATDARKRARQGVRSQNWRLKLRQSSIEKQPQLYRVTILVGKKISS